MTAAEVRALREGYGLSRDALARLLGVTVNTVFRWETEKDGKQMSVPQPYLKAAIEHLMVCAREGRRKS